MTPAKPQICGDGHRHGHGVDGAAVEHGLEIPAAQLRPEQHERQRDGAQQADVDVELPDVEQQEEDGHRNEGDDQLRLAACAVITRVERVELEVLAAFAGAVDEQVHDDEDRGDLRRRAHETGHQCHIGRRAEHGHGGYVRDLRAAGHGQREGERARAQNAEDELLRDIAALENDQRDRVHEHDDDAGDDAAEVEDGADDQDHRHADEVFAGIAHVLLEQAVHDGVGDGVGGAALRVDLRLQAAEEDHEEEALDGGEHTADIVADEAVDKRQRVAGDDDARAGKCGQIDRPVFIAEIDNDQKTKDTADDAQC